MDIAVARESPLGRYLAGATLRCAAALSCSLLQSSTRTSRISHATHGCAPELDGEDATDSLAALLQQHDPQTPSSAPEAAPATRTAAYHVANAAAIAAHRFVSAAAKWVESLRTNAGHVGVLWFLEHVTRVLEDHSALYDELDEQLAIWRQRDAPRWWLARADNSIVSAVQTRVGSSSAFAVAVGALGVSYHVTTLRVATLVIATVLGVALTIELMYQLMVLLHWHSARELLRAIQSYSDARRALETSYQESLALVKKAELATRGYRIGRLLPPVQRIESATRMTCRRMRLRLRAINDGIGDAAVRLETGAWLAVIAPEGEVADREAEDQEATAPSLLITALTKRHDLASVLLERALHTALLQHLDVSSDPSLSSASSSRQVRRADGVAPLCAQLHALVAALVRWRSELEQLNTSKSMRTVDAAAATTLDSSSSSCSGDASDAKRLRSEPLSVRDRAFDTAQERASELRTACETLKHLVFAAQQDLTELSTAGADETMEATSVASLGATRELMQAMVESIAAAWTQYDEALAALGANGKEMNASLAIGSLDDCESSDATAAVDSASDLVAQRAREAARMRAEQERTCTFVFTGTSTGERDFDLRAILRQQQEEREVAPLTPSFVRELQDVLAHRETLSQATVTKRIDQDLPAAENDGGASGRSALTNTEQDASSPAASSAALQHALLSSLLQHSRARALSEEVFD